MPRLVGGEFHFSCRCSNQSPILKREGGRDDLPPYKKANSPLGVIRFTGFVFSSQAIFPKYKPTKFNSQGEGCGMERLLSFFLKQIVSQIY